MRTKFGVDPACEVLADHFLSDEPALADRKGELAAAIQHAVETWFEYDAKHSDIPPVAGQPHFPSRGSGTTTKPPHQGTAGK